MRRERWKMLIVKGFPVTNTTEAVNSFFNWFKWSWSINLRSETIHFLLRGWTRFSLIRRRFEHFSFHLRGILKKGENRKTTRIVLECLGTEWGEKVENDMVGCSSDERFKLNFQKYPLEYTLIIFKLVCFLFLKLVQTWLFN